MPSIEDEAYHDDHRLPSSCFNNTLGRVYDDGHSKLSQTGALWSRYHLATEGLYHAHIPLGARGD